MSELTYNEITEIANGLELNFTELRNDARARYDLYSLRRIPTLPQDLAREGQVNVLSPLVAYSAHTIRADLMMNPTEFMCIPLARESGGVPTKDQRKADGLERALAVLWNKLNANRHVDREVIWHQLVSPYAVIQLECENLDYPEQGGLSDSDYAAKIDAHQRQLFPWSISTPDPLTCSWLERGGKPVIFVRRYKQMVWDIQKMYSRRKGSNHEGADLMYDKGRWLWKQVSDDFDRFGNNPASAAGLLREAEVIWLDDGEMVYHVVLNDNGVKGGEVVWSGPNPFGCVSAFIVPSSVTPLREMHNRYEPYLWPLMNVIDQINVVRSIRATASRNVSGPDNYIPLDPQLSQFYEQNNKALPKAHRWKRNETPYLLGEIKEKPAHVDPDLDKLELMLQQDLQRLLPSPFVNVIDPAVLKETTATAILHAAESGMRMYGPLMATYDSAIKDIMEAVLNTVSNFYKGETFYAYSNGTEYSRGVQLKEGSVYTLSDKDLDFAYMMEVKTRSMTQAQAAAQYELRLQQWILPDGSKGPATYDDLLDAANFSDKEAQKEKLAAERILARLNPILEELALGEAIAKIETKLGIKLPLEVIAPLFAGGGMPAGTGPEQPAALPNAAQRMDAPLVTGPQGGTSPVPGQ